MKKNWRKKIQFADDFSRSLRHRDMFLLVSVFRYAEDSPSIRVSFAQLYPISSRLFWLMIKFFFFKHTIIFIPKKKTYKFHKPSCTEDSRSSSFRRLQTNRMWTMKDLTKCEAVNKSVNFCIFLHTHIAESLVKVDRARPARAKLWTDNLESFVIRPNFDFFFKSIFSNSDDQKNATLCISTRVLNDKFYPKMIHKYFIFESTFG